MCLYPKIIINKRYVPNKKNGGIPPQCPDDRLRHVTAACGKCFECRRQKSQQWLVRMEEELKQNPYAIFVTLTLDEENLRKLKKLAKSEDIHNTSKLAIRRFLERIRKKTGQSIKHWFIDELGHENTKRLHLHGIMWGDIVELKKLTKECWNYGFVFIGQYVSERTIRYITKYITKEDTENKGFTGKVFCSAGIGKGYEESLSAKNNKFAGAETKEYYRLKNGQKINMPVYYRNKLYTDVQREELFLHKIIKGDVWVNGIKINMHENQELYLTILEQERKRCEQLHGDKPQEWDKEKYVRRISKQREWRRKEQERLRLVTQIIDDYAPF